MKAQGKWKKKDNSVFELCQKIIENGKLTEDEVYNLSDLINKTITACDNDSINWPTNLLIKPLQKVWYFGSL